MSTILRLKGLNYGRQVILSLPTSPPEIYKKKREGLEQG